ncbi:MAG TPA: TrkA family potassium uptake protein [Deferrisomatales bacterium]|nr:TrkA family potassium uptake protein [Deferrisomatales bacterium]
MPRSRIVIVGLGAIGRQLLDSLPREFEVVCIDRDDAKANPALRPRAGGVRRVTGDATSRLVLEDAGVGSADAVVITTASERVNREVARVIQEQFAVPRVLSLAITPEGTAGLEALGVEVVNLFRQSAQALRNRLERRAQVAHGFGLERGEILEVEVHPNSRLAGKTLRQLAPGRWRVGLIYRDGEILLPRGDVVLRGRDRVVLTGDPSVVRTVSEMLAFRFERFPLEYGSTLAVCLTGGEGDGLRREVEYLSKTLPLEQVVLLALPAAEGDLEAYRQVTAGAGGLPPVRVASRAHWGDAIAAVAGAPQTRPGLVVFARDSLFGPGTRPGASKRLLHTLSQGVGCPVLLAAGTCPSRRVAVPCVAGLELRQVLESVFEMESYLQHEVRGLLVRPSAYLSAESEDSGFVERRNLLHEMSLMVHSSAEAVELAGNPVRAVLGALGESDLLVVDTGGWTGSSWIGAALNPEPVWPIVRRAGLSTLLVPPEEEAL